MTLHFQCLPAVSFWHCYFLVSILLFAYSFTHFANFGVRFVCQLLVLAVFVDDILKSLLDNKRKYYNKLSIKYCPRRSGATANQSGQPGDHRVQDSVYDNIAFDHRWTTVLHSTSRLYKSGSKENHSSRIEWGTMRVGSRWKKEYICCKQW